MTFHKQTYGNYEHLKNCFEGQDVYIVGSGISLIGFNFEKLRNLNTIAINHAYKDVPEFNFHLFVDSRFVDEAGIDLDNSPWNKITCSHSLFHTRPYLSVIRPSNEFHRNPIDGFYTAMNSGCFAISTAIYMGAKRIFLLGIDCRFADKDEAVYIARHNGNLLLAENIEKNGSILYGHYSSGKYRHTQDEKRHEEVFLGYSKLYDKFIGEAEIYNCSLWSKISCFPIAEIL